MDQRDIFTRLAQYPFSYSSLEKFNNASLSLRQRYPGLKCSESIMPGIDVQASYKDHPFSVPAHWHTYKNGLWNVETGEDPVIMSLCDTDNLFLGETAVEHYLELLQKQFTDVKIREIQTIGNIGHIDNGAPRRVSIIPFHTKHNSKDSWAFAVVYQDCIHWFDSTPDAPVPQFPTQDSRRIEIIWTGPKFSRDADSGVFMLLGIRLILSGKPHLEEISQSLVNDFRCLMVIELLCRKINPSEEDFKALPQVTENGIDEIVESHFEDAMAMEGFQSQLDPTTDESSQDHLGNSTFDANVIFASSTYEMREPDITAPYLVETVNEENGSNAPSWRAPRGQESPSGNLRAVSEMPPVLEEEAERSPQRRSDGIAQPRQPLRRTKKDDRKIILELLSEAFVASRSRKDLRPTDLFVLWSLVDQGAVASTFFQRYYSVRFWEETKDLQDKDLKRKLGTGIRSDIKNSMMNCRKECKLWWELCNLWCPNDPGNPKKYTVCAIPLDGKAKLDKYAYNSVLKRLADATDSLSRYLKKAEELCLLLTSNSVPDDLLIIDNFLFKTNIDIDDRQFEIFLSPVSQARISLSR